jgi:hypothetical protein
VLSLVVDGRKAEWTLRLPCIERKLENVLISLTLCPRNSPGMDASRAVLPLVGDEHALLTWSLDRGGAGN